MFKNILKNSTTLLTQQQTSILSAAFVIMSMSLVAKILGLVKLRLLVHYFGDGNTTAVFIAANKFPEILFDTLIFAILSVSFIPLYAGYYAKDEIDKASRLASAAINITIVLYTLFAIVTIIFAEPLAYIMAPGLVNENVDNLHLMTAILRYSMLAQFFLIIGGYLTAILQSHQRFLIPAIAMTMYNVSIVIGLIILAPYIGIYSAIAGMFIGGLLQFLIQMPFLSTTSFRYSLRFSLKTAGIGKMFLLSIPRMVGNMSATLIENLHIILASFLGALSIVSLEYATRLAIVPVSLFGAAIAQAALPSLTISWSEDKKEKFMELFVSAFNQILFFALPVAAIFSVLRLPIIRLLFGDPNFTWDATVTTGRTLAVLSIGVISQSAIMLFARAFYAMQDTKTPVYISLVTLFIDAILAVYLIGVLRMPVWYLAGVYSFTTLINAIILLWVFTRRVNIISFGEVLLSPLKLLICTGVMILVMYIPFRLMDIYVWEQVHNIGIFTLPPNLRVFILDTRYTANVIALTATAASLGGLVYLGLAIFLKVEEVKLVTSALRKLTSVKRILTQSQEVIETDRQSIR